MTNFDNTERKYLSELKKQFPTRNSVCAELIRLNAILNLPKGTEHFLSDIHGEWEAFSHIRRNASGVIRNKKPAVEVLPTPNVIDGAFTSTTLPDAILEPP